MECNACKLVELSLAGLMSIEKEKINIKKGKKRDEKEAKIITIKYLKYIF
jgi:uncharacterized protein YggU (UPF0235/DUF167 family)